MVGFTAACVGVWVWGCIVMICPPTYIYVCGIVCGIVCVGVGGCVDTCDTVSWYTSMSTIPLPLADVCYLDIDLC